MTCVVKIGGSILRHLDWPSRFERWIDRQPNDDFYVLVGGGDAIEAMRHLDRIHGLAEEAMHWRCIRLLDATHAIAAELLPNALNALEWDDLQARVREKHANGRRIILSRVGGFYSENTDRSAIARPPIGWQTTTDTIAAYLARLLSASRVVLLKSCPITEGIDLRQAAAQGIVDAALCTFAGDMPIELEQLVGGE